MAGRPNNPEWPLEAVFCYRDGRYLGSALSSTPRVIFILSIWSGLGMFALCDPMSRALIFRCDDCAKSFEENSHHELPPFSTIPMI